MQGLCDGYFVIPYTIGDYLAGHSFSELDTKADAFEQSHSDVQSRLDSLLAIDGNKTVGEYHRELGMLMWEYVGMERTEEGLTKVLSEIPKLREDFWQNVKVPGANGHFNKNLEMAGRVADFFELGELMAADALDRSESCGGHFRAESQTDEGEALRRDDEFSYVSAWEFAGVGNAPTLHKEPLEFQHVKLTQRSYK